MFSKKFLSLGAASPAPVPDQPVGVLNEQTRRQIKRIEITAKKQVDEVFAGRYESLFKGRGVEFAEVREYQPGDDVRSIDWNVTARAGRPFVKKYTEERQLTVILVVDASASQDFGTGEESKREVASEIASILGFSALRNNDKVGLLLFTDRVEKYLPPRKGKRHALRLVREILQPRPEGHKTDLSAALDYLNRVHRKRALVFLLSDFLGQSINPLLRVTARRHDLSAFRLFDPIEEEMPRIGRMRLRDLETGETLLVNTNSPAFESRYKQSCLERRQQLRKSLEAAGADYAEFSTARPVAATLVRFFESDGLASAAGREEAMKHLPLACLVALACSGLAWAQPASTPTVQVAARVDRSRVKLGETLVLTEDVSYPADLEVVLPKPESLTFPPFEVRDAIETSLPASGGRQVARYTVRLAAYEDGKLTIPPLQIDYQSAEKKSEVVQSAPLAIEVQRAAGVPLPAAAPAPPASGGRPTASTVDIHDIKPMGTVPTPLWLTMSKVAAVALPVLLAALGLALFLKRKLRLPSTPSTPDGLALAELDRLAAEDLPRQGLVKLHYDRLAQILRTYLARRYQLPVLEHTTLEVVQMMGTQDLSSRVGPILNEADLVKFAKQQVPADQALTQITAVREVVESTRPPALAKEA